MELLTSDLNTYMHLASAMSITVFIWLIIVGCCVFCLTHLTSDSIKAYSIVI